MIKLSQYNSFDSRCETLKKYNLFLIPILGIILLVINLMFAPGPRLFSLCNLELIFYTPPV